METTRRPPTTFDRIARLVALLMLAVILAVVYWIPFELIDNNGIAPAAVLSVLTLAAVSMASRLHRLRVRLRELEARVLALEPQK